MSKTRLSSLKLAFYLPNSLKLLIFSQCVGTAAKLVSAGHEPSMFGCGTWGQDEFTVGFNNLQGLFLRKWFPDAVIRPGPVALGEGALCSGHE